MLTFVYPLKFFSIWRHFETSKKYKYQRNILLITYHEYSICFLGIGRGSLLFPCSETRVLYQKKIALRLSYINKIVGEPHTHTHKQTYRSYLWFLSEDHKANVGCCWNYFPLPKKELNLLNIFGHIYCLFYFSFCLVTVLQEVTCLVLTF